MCRDTSSPMSLIHALQNACHSASRFTQIFVGNSTHGFTHEWQIPGFTCFIPHLMVEYPPPRHFLDPEANFLDHHKQTQALATASMSPGAGDVQMLAMSKSKNSTAINGHRLHKRKQCLCKLQRQTKFLNISEQPGDSSHFSWEKIKQAMRSK